MHLSVIIPTLAKPETAVSLARRVSELLPDLRIEFIVVMPLGKLPPSDDKLVSFISDSGRGVYMAYRAGLARACGEYCWFMGDDDYPLDGAAQLSEFILSGEIDLLVAPVVFSSGRIYRPTHSMLVLHFLNWCQQGVIYRRSLLQRRRFFRRLSVQADQFVNVLLRADPAVTRRFFEEPICVFGVHGVSGRLHDSGYAGLRTALARRTLSASGFLAFRLLLLAEPLVKLVVKLR